MKKSNDYWGIEAVIEGSEWFIITDSKQNSGQITTLTKKLQKLVTYLKM